MRDEALAFVKKLEEHGIPVTSKVYEYMVHGFHLMYKVVPQQVEELFADLKNFIYA